MNKLMPRKHTATRALAVVKKLSPKDRGILKGNYLVAFCSAVIVFSLFELGYVAFASLGKRGAAASEAPLEVRRPTASKRAFVASEPFVMAPPSHANVTIGSATFQVELARTEAERRNGLSGRQSLPEGTGLLFYFPIL